MSMADKVVDNFIGILVVATVASALLGTVISALTNLSLTVTVLGVLFVTVIPILIAVGLYKAASKMAKL